MPNDRLRRRLAFEAARLIFSREERQYGPAKLRAARQLVAGPVGAEDMPCNREVRGCLQAIARSGRVEQQRLLTQDSAQRALGLPVAAGDSTLDRFRTYELLLLPLEDVMQSPDEHPEGDVLYHSLQVFELARQQLPYDEEFLLAALLHDVGKSIDRRNHVVAGLAALADTISPRTAWLIEHHVEALQLTGGSLGVRLRRRLASSEDIDELILLAECDRRGRVAGADVSDVWDALRYIRSIGEEYGEPAP